MNMRRSVTAMIAAVLFSAVRVTPVFAQDLTVVMVGDILLHDGIEKCARQEDGSYDFSELFKHTKDVIEGADLAIVNQEVIIGGQDLRVTGYPSFNAPYAICDSAEYGSSLG